MKHDTGESGLLMAGGRSIMLLAVSLAVGACTHATEFLPMYTQDFQQDPEWVTNNPADYRWTGDAFQTKQLNGSEEYAFHQLEHLDGRRAFRLVVDIRPVKYQWATDGYIGFFDSDMCTESPVSVFLHPALTDEGEFFRLSYRDRDGGSGDAPFAPFQRATWYTASIDYDPTARTLNASVVERDSGQRIGSVRLDSVGSFEGIDRIATLTVCHTYARGHEGVTEFDNIEVWQNVDHRSLDAGGNNPDGARTLISWASSAKSNCGADRSVPVAIGSQLRKR